MSDYQNIKFLENNGRVDLVLDRAPDNKFNVEMMEEIVHALRGIREDERIKVLLIRGSKNNFCAGIETSTRAPDEMGLLVPLYTRMFDYLNDICGLTVAAVDGQAFDAGFELAAFCDVTFAAKSAKFCHPEINMGVFPMISAAILPRLVGRSTALDWILSGRVIDSEEAMNTGVVNKVFSDGSLMQEMNEYADRLAGMSSPAIVWTKRAIDRSLYTPVMDALRVSESAYMIDLMTNLDPQEGIRAAIEGKTAVWRDK